MTGLTTFHPESSGYWLQSSGDRQLTYDDGNNGGTAYIMIDADNHWIASGRASPGQAAGVDAQYYAKIVDDYYWTVHGRNSFNNNGASMLSIVHYLNNYDNAFWNGSLVVFGDGDGVSFREFSGALDVVGHEWTHAVTEYTSNLTYQNEPGALNESFSDIMGTSIEFFADAQNPKRDPARPPDWLIGEDIDLQGDGFRNMANPGADGDPDHYTERYTGTGDNGGVHTNSGIPNHAYYLLVNGGRNAGCVSPNNHPHCTDTIDTQDNNLTVTGIGLTAAEQIFYLAFTGLPSNATMCNARAAAEAKASALFGSASQQKLSTTDAWVAVGLTDAVCGGAPPPPPPPSPTMHVGDLDGSRSNAPGNKWNARVTITIHNGNHQPLASATVSGSWSAGASGSASCTTNSSGQCSVTKSSISRGTNSVTFTVTAVTHATNTYQAIANHDPDGDSNGTSIIVRKP